MMFQLPKTVSTNIEYFTGRTWLLPQLLKWLEQTEDRMFMLTGEPGTGKSMIIAWLAGAGPLPGDAGARAQLKQICSLVKATHFCVATSGSVSPTNFAENVANQLTHNVPGFSDALAATLEDRVRISTVQQIGKMEPGSSATGMYIENLDLGGLGEELSFEQALHKPLRKLCTNGYNKPILLLVDALDEAITYTGKIDLVQLLKKLSDLPQNVRFLVTTRPDPRVLKFYNKIKPLDLLEETPKDVDDVRLYACERLAELEYEPRNKLADRIAQAAQGIFLYAHLVINDLLARLPEIPDLDAISLPSGLSGLYHDFLNRELGSDENRWYEIFEPLLGLIAVAQGDGLNRDQIECMIDKDVRKALRVCKQYLTGNLPDGPFRPFHQSFADFLLRDEKNVDYHINAIQMHRQIAEYYLKKYGKQWKNCDPYGLHYLPTHQIQAELWEGVEQVLTDLRFIEAKCATGMTYDLVADYNTALDGLPDPDAQQERAEKQQREARVQKYIHDLIAYAKGEIATLKIIESVEPWSEERIKADIERIKTNPTRFDRIRAFAQFVNAESHALVKFTAHPGFCMQQAYNSTNAGPVASAAEVIAHAEEQNVLLQQLPFNRPDYNPNQALLRTLAGHTGPVESVSVTSDGRRVVSGSDDGAVRVWDLATGRCLQTLEGHTDEVWSVSVTPDGQRAVSGSKDHTVRVWDLARGRCLQMLEGHTDHVWSVSVTPDGHHAVSGGADGTMRVWDLARGRCLKTLKGHTDYFSVSVTPDGQRAVSGSKDHTVRAWDLATGRCLQTLEGHTNEVWSVSVTPDGHCAVSGSKDHTVRVWDLARGRCLQMLEGHTDRVWSVSVTPDGHHAVSGGADGTMRVWDLARGHCLKTLKGHTDYLKVSVSSDGRCAVSGGADDTVRVWDLATGRCLQMLEGHTDVVFSVSVTPDGQRAVSGSEDHTVRVWDLELGCWLHAFTRHTNGDNNANVTPDDRRAMLGGEDQLVQMGDLIHSYCLHTLKGHTDEVWSVSVTPDGRRAVSGSRDGTVRVWDLVHGRCLQTLEGHMNWDWIGGRSAAMAFAMVGLSSKLQGMVWSVNITPDGQRAISGGSDRTVKMWDLLHGRCLQTLEGHTDDVQSVSVTPDGQCAVSGSRDHTVRVWSLATGHCLQTLEGHTDEVRSVSVTPDDRRAVSGSLDGIVQVWDLERGVCLHTFEGHKYRITSASFTPDGRYAVSSSADVRVWDLTNEACICIYQPRSRVTSISTIPPRKHFVCSTITGEVLFLTLRNVPIDPPVITPCRLWLYGESGNAGQWDAHLTTVCLVCGTRFLVAANLLDVISSITRNANLSDDQSPCLDLPAEAWDEPKLLSKCPLCRQPLKFNPFVVDNRGRYV